jgi:hypothetical protein
MHVRWWQSPLQAIHHPDNSIFEPRGVEVDQQSDAAIDQFERRQGLHLINGRILAAALISTTAHPSTASVMRTSHSRYVGQSLRLGVLRGKEGPIESASPLA